MQVSSISNAIISSLGNPDSRVPLAIKDCINSAGITYFSYDAGGKLEGKDRFIDEFGTEVIWLFGLPFFKTLADKTIYKLKNLNPGVDVRVTTSQDHVDFARKILDKNNNSEKNILKDIDDTVKNSGTFKKLFYSKFGFATVMTFASYFALTHYKQKITEKNVEKEYLVKRAKDKFMEDKSKESKHFASFSAMTFGSKNKKNNQPAFKGIESFMFNPVKNMMIIDAGITGERLHKSRNTYEFMEYAIKEGSFLFFMYLAGKWVQNGLQKTSEKLFKTPIEMDLRFINSESLKQAAGTQALLDEISKFKKITTQKGILDFIADNQGSTIVTGAKMSGIIGEINNSGKIDPSVYIDTNAVKDFVDSLEKFIQKGQEFVSTKAKKEHNIEQYLKRAKNLKIGAILGNIGICCFALGYLMPKAMFDYRKKYSGTKDFHVQKQVEQKLEQKYSDDTI